MPKLQAAAEMQLKDSWQPYTKSIPNTAWFPYAYENTAAGSSLRNLVADICYGLKREHFIEKPEHFPYELLLDYAIFSSRSVKSPIGMSCAWCLGKGVTVRRLC